MKTNILLLTIILSFHSLTAQRREYYPPPSASYDNPYDEPGNGYTPYNQSFKYSRQKIQVALILDVSGSMNGLLHQAQSQLWSIVNTLVYENDYPPVLEIALYEYGSNRWGPRQEYLHKLIPFTRDMDWLSDLLFQIRTGGNREYSGAAIQAAVNELDWSHSSRDLKLIFIAGNESFSQGPVPFERAIYQARRKGIVVNTIFCGDYHRGISLGWQKAASMSGGDYFNIDHNQQLSFLSGYHDQQLYQLNKQLNQTYIPYGGQGKNFQQRQWQQDEHALQIGMGYHSQRTLTKASSNYQNPDWDLVDAVISGNIKLNELPNSQLPEEMWKMTPQEKLNYINKKRGERSRIQQQIITLSRKQPMQNQHQQTDLPEKTVQGRQITLDKAIIESVRHQREKQLQESAPVQIPESQESNNPRKPDVRQPERPSRISPRIPERTPGRQPLSRNSR